MAKAKKVEDVNERILKKLERVEDLLVTLVALQACISDANRNKVARVLEVNNAAVSRVASVLKKKTKKKE